MTRESNMRGRGNRLWLAAVPVAMFFAMRLGDKIRQQWITGHQCSFAESFTGLQLGEETAGSIVCEHRSGDGAA